MLLPRALVTVLLLALVLATGAEARSRTEKVYWQVNAVVPSRFGEQLGFIPMKEIRPARWFTVTAGKRRYRVRWNNTVSNATNAESIRTTFEFDPDAGLFLDRRLTSAERRREDVLADVARDADLLVVNPQNPACAGLTYAQARSIAAGEITDWSQVGSSAGHIDLHLTGQGFPYGLFGVEQLPPGASLSPSGGLGSVPYDPGAASVVSFSTARNLDTAAACIVPLDGVPVSEQSVRSLTYPGAYPISFVMSKQRSRQALERLKVKRYVAFLRSERARSALAARGVVLP